MPSDVPPPSRDELALKYLEQLPYTPYPVQEEALLAWFDTETGVLVSIRPAPARRSSPRRPSSKPSTPARPSTTPLR